MHFIGYDLGNARIKAALFDGSNNKVLQVLQYPGRDMDIISRRAGWAEQQPELWWMHLCTITRKLLATTGVDPEDIRGIGIAYQMHGLVLMDSEDQVLRPSIIWNDSRAVSIGKQAFREMGEQYCLENMLNSPGNFTASKLKWVKDNEPDIYQRIDKIMLPGDYLAYKLSGKKQTTLSGLSEAILWNFSEKRMAREVLDYYELDASVIPDQVGTFSIQAKVSREGSEMTGLAEGTPISYRAGDQPNNALSLNVLNPGEIAAISESSGVVYGILDRPIFDSKSRVNAFAHVNYEENFDRIGVLLCLNGAGSLYSWMRHQVARKDRTYDDMERMASTVPVGCDGLSILPFGNGAERILENKNINSQVFNFQFNRHKRAHLYRAALEGVAFAFVYGVNILKEMGLEVNIIRVANDNMFRSHVFSSTIATLLNCEIEVVETTGAIGAARAAGVATGYYTSLAEALSGLQICKIYEPEPDQKVYQQAYNFWLNWLSQILTGNASTGNSPQALLRNLDKLQTQNQHQQKDIAQNALQILSQRELLKEVRQELLSIRKGHADTERIRDFCNRIDQELQPQKWDGWENFIRYFDVLHDDLFKQLKSRYPELSQTELQLCILIKMNLTNKEIAENLHLSIRGVETRRYRLRKKLLLPPNSSLTDFFAEIGQVEPSA